MESLETDELLSEITDEFNSAKDVYVAARAEKGAAEKKNMDSGATILCHSNKSVGEAVSDVETIEVIDLHDNSETPRKKMRDSRLE